MKPDHPEQLGLAESLSRTNQNAHKSRAAAPTYLEFFAGSGLVAQGMKGVFRPVWANDIDSKKARVYAANHSNRHFHLGSITDVRGADLPSADMAWASFPCQDLSLAGLTQGIHGKRSGLVWEWLRIIDEMEQAPPVLVAENVLGLVATSGGKHYRQLHEALSARGYAVGAILLDAVRFVPQSRPRIFVVAVRTDLYIPERLLADGPGWLHPEAIRKAASGLEHWLWWSMPEPPRRKTTVTDLVDLDTPFADTESDVKNLRMISPRHAEILKEDTASLVVAPGYKRTRNGQQVLELRFDGVAGCLRTPGGGSSRQVVVIKRDGVAHSRLITVREAARLMGAPDSYKLPGSYNEGYKAMGDAVAVPVAKWIAKHLLAPIVHANPDKMPS